MEQERDYELVSERFWSQRQKPGEEENRDLLFMDDQILHDHLERVIGRFLPGVRTVLDAGGGTGRFSVWLAEQGLQVTHLDLSLPMLEAARKRAEAANVAERITFIHRRITDLKAYADGEFDLVLSLDAPVSYTYPKHQDVLTELVRIADKAVVVSVTSRLGAYPCLFQPASKQPFLVDEFNPDTAMQWYVREARMAESWIPNYSKSDRILESGLFEDPESVYLKMNRGEAPWPVTYAFRPEELEDCLSAAGLKGIHLSGPGALARTLPREALLKLLYTPELRNGFLERCYHYDSEPSVCGMGKDNLVAAGYKGKASCE